MIFLRKKTYYIFRSYGCFFYLFCIQATLEELIKVIIVVFSELKYVDFTLSDIIQLLELCLLHFHCDLKKINLEQRFSVLEGIQKKFLHLTSTAH